MTGYGRYVTYMTETQFAGAVMDLARLGGWKAVHFRPARTKDGWRTAMTGDQGFVDLVLARDGEVLHVELKAEHGRLGKGQPEWAAALGPTYRLWRPSDMDQIREELRRKF